MNKNNKKILNFKDLNSFRLKNKKSKIILCHGTFDFLHYGHLLHFKKAKEFGLDWHPINYEVCDYFEMIGHMSYHGMPSHYNHWSYGKSFEVTHQQYNMGMQGLPYELIINSNPSIAYLMRENPLYLSSSQMERLVTVLQ